MTTPTPVELPEISLPKEIQAMEDQIASLISQLTTTQTTIMQQVGAIREQINEKNILLAAIQSIKKTPTLLNGVKLQYNLVDGPV